MSNKSRRVYLSDMALAAGFLFAACTGPSANGNAEADMGADLASVDSVSAVADVAGTCVKTHVSEAGTATDSAVDLSAATLEVLVPNSSGDGYVTYTGTGKSDGTFTVAGVPNGVAFFLHYYNSADSAQHRYFYTSSHSIDLGAISGQRSGVTIGLSNPELAWNAVSGIDSWAAGDSLQYYSSDVGLYLNGKSPANGATSLSVSQFFDGQPLIDSSAGDKLYVTQLHETTTSKAVAISTAQKSVQLSMLMLQNGKTTTLSNTDATFTAPPMQSTTLDFKRSQFAALQSGAAPVANLSPTATYSLYVSAILGGSTLQYGFYTYSADLLVHSSTEGTDLDYGTASFGNPFSSRYGLFGYANANFIGTYTLPGTKSGAPVSAGCTRIAALSDFSSAAITPKLGPPTSLKINGEDAQTTTAPFTMQPVLSWNAPQLGTPTHYQVGVIRIYASSAMRTVQQQVALIVTPETRVVLPPGLLTSGEHYVFRISSVDRGGSDLSKPFRISLPESNAAALTAMGVP